jgi:transcriptional regulator with XRE-family HTH domain
MNPMPEYQPIEPLEPMNNNPSGKSRVSMISLLERHLRKPTLDVFLRISGALGVDLWRVLKSATEKAKGV